MVGVDLEDQTTLFCCEEIQVQLSTEEGVGPVETLTNSANKELPAKTVVYRLPRARVCLLQLGGGYALCPDGT